ncbi:MAG TPA: serine hydrolase domain-containing protein [Streptosporangiaceae bacterium]|jgi:CubicO group peptidase (beta-lactamase class C family)|nr:serine hydrolase domain-containing protein [Streptosporangiaceae bacterium]
MGQLAAGLPPAAATAVCSPAGVRYRAAGGWANLGYGASQPVPASDQTLFDLASLTKVVATVPLVLLLHQRGTWDIDDPIARWLPGAPPSPVTLRDCLSHTSGLIAHRPYYAGCEDAPAIRRAVVAELATARGGPVVYSDLNFMLLGWAVEECAGEPFASLLQREVLGPLGMTATTYRPDAPRTSIAATEVDGDQRLVPGTVWGEVHDGNAFALGGVSGHAGLFSTAADLAAFTTALLVPERHPVLSAATIGLMTTRQAADGDDIRALGWRLKPSGWGAWPAGTFWHTGFTGTSLLISPPLGTAVVLLTNAVHPVRRLPEAGLMRATVHRAVRRAVGSPPAPLTGSGGR